MSRAALFIIAKIWKLICLSTDGCIKMYTHTHTHTCTYTLALYSVIKNKILLFGATQKDLKGTVLSGISQREKHKYCMISLTHGI